MSLSGLRPEFQTLLDQFDPVAMRVPVEPPHVTRINVIAEIGRAAADHRPRHARADRVHRRNERPRCGTAVTHPARIRWKDVWYTCEQVGVNALPIVALISFLLGIILAFQAAVPMRQFGAEIFVADLVGLSILRELGPLMTAILLAGRSGAAFAAEIGTMKVNEELNALTTMGLDPVRFLVVTRIIAAVLMMPLLTLFADLIGILGGALTMITFNIPIASFLHEVDSLVDVKDLLAGLAKAPVFAILIAGIGCLRGLQTQTGASAVGISATRAVVSASSCWLSSTASTRSSTICSTSDAHAPHARRSDHPRRAPDRRLRRQRADAATSTSPSIAARSSSSSAARAAARARCSST